MVYRYDMTLGLPHTNRRGLWEPYLLMQAGHYQWGSIAAAIGRPLSELRTMAGGEVYAAFYYIEERIPDRAPIESFGLDTAMQFAVALRSFKNMALEGLVSFDRAGVLDDPALEHPQHPLRQHLHHAGAGQQRVARRAAGQCRFLGDPAAAQCRQPLPVDARGGETGSLGVIEAGWTPIGEAFEFLYEIDADRDTNGAGLVYFVHYITVMEMAERAMFETGARREGERSLRHRRTAYYGNADPRDTIRVRISAYRHPGGPGRVGLRYAIDRQQDGQLICLSEAVKAIV